MSVRTATQTCNGGKCVCLAGHLHRTRHTFHLHNHVPYHRYDELQPEDRCDPDLLLGLLTASVEQLKEEAQ